VGQPGPRRAPSVTREIVALPQRPKTGQEVSFSVEAVDASGKPPACVWNFGDDATAEGLRVKRVFDKPGRHYVLARLTDSGSGDGRMDWYELDVTEK
jgi:hypothetical protein